MSQALLLSPDDQAVSAITCVLEEMSVKCERPLDGISAAEKLNSHSFDLVLVDCENLSAAKLIFDVCRRGKDGSNPVRIAIVDGGAGLPTAFRLGAELILTKPVAKDQARNTIRTAVTRVRKEVPANESVSAQPASAAVTSAAVPEERALAAAAASSQLTSFADPAPSFVSASVPTAALPATISAPVPTAKMHSAADEIDATPATPKLNPPSASFSASPLSETSSDRAASVSSRPARPVKLSGDPVHAELEESEVESSKLENSGLGKAAADQPAAESDAPVFSSYPQSQPRRKRTRGSLVALLMFVLAGGGFYAAWTYQPGFREIAQPQIDRVLALAGKVLPPTSAQNPAKPSAQLASAAASAPAAQSPTALNRTQSTAPDYAIGSATTSATATARVQPTATPGPAVAPPTSGATAAPAATKPEASKPSDSRKPAAAAASSDAQLPGEDSAIILSSKGAEKRLERSVPPKYPVEARSGGTEGTVVLKEVVDENGKVEGLRLVEGDAVLATAAMQAVKQWRYRPYVRDGKAQPFQTVVIVDFQRP